MDLHHVNGNRRPRNFVPRCEGLEDRCCPSANIITLGHTMFVIGDAAANTVTIQGDGHGNVTASITSPTGSATATKSGINAILVDTRGGDDVINYALTGDVVQRMAVAIFAGAGNDTVSVQANGHNIAAGGLLALAIDGGYGNDAVSVDYQGQILGALLVAVYGGDGADTLAANLTADPGSTGVLAAAVLGGTGNDNLTLNVNDNSGGGGASTLAAFYALLDGGPGTDTCVHTPNVKAVHCEI